MDPEETQIDSEQLISEAVSDTGRTQLESLIKLSTEGREHFSTIVPGHQIAWDST